MWKIGFASFLFLKGFLDLFGVRRVVVVATGVSNDFSVRHTAASAASLFLLLSERFQAHLGIRTSKAIQSESTLSSCGTASKPCYHASCGSCTDTRCTRDTSSTKDSSRTSVQSRRRSLCYRLPDRSRSRRQRARESSHILPMAHKREKENVSVNTKDSEKCCKIESDWEFKFLFEIIFFLSFTWQLVSISVLFRLQLRIVVVRGTDFNDFAVPRPAANRARRFLAIAREGAAPVSGAGLLSLVGREQEIFDYEQLAAPATANEPEFSFGCMVRG